MTTQLWIGFGFAAVMVVFLMITFFVKDKSSPTQYKTLRFLTALCGGFAGGLMLGEASFAFNKELSDGAKLAISGTAGIAIFFTVWFTYGKREQNPLEDRIQISIPQGWTFELAARSIVRSAQAIVHFEGFEPEQLQLVLPATDIDAPNAKRALAQLRYTSGNLPDYRIDIVEGVYHIRA